MILRTLALLDFQACLVCGLYKDKKWEWWSPPFGLLKFNVMGATRSKPGPAGIGGVLSNHEGHMLLSFSNSVGIKDSSKAQILTILEVMRSFKSSYHDSMSLLLWKVILLILFLGFQVQLGAVGMFLFFSFFFFILMRSSFCLRRWMWS